MPDITNQVEYVLKVSGANEAAAEMQTLGGAAQQAGAKSDGLSVSTVALGSALGGFAQQAAKAAIDALRRLVTDAINLTVEMDDLADAMTYIYSSAGPELVASLDNISEATGYARSELYGISRDIGRMIVPMGVAREEAAGMAKDLTQASADTAAALGLELSEAAGLVEQALRGSTRGARQLGIDLSEAAMNAELAAMGISGTASSVDEATKMQARYNIIMEATARYSGAAAAEMDTAFVRDILQQAAALGALDVRFTGGEPLLREDFAELYLFARRLGLRVTLFTNARRITPELAQLMGRIVPGKPVEVTVYGMHSESYDAVAARRGA